MPKRMKSNSKQYEDRLKKVGMLFQEKRWSICKGSRESFIEDRNEMLFSNVNENKDWISLRYLNNIETGKNLPSIEMLIKLSIALETDPVEMFENIYNILYDRE